MFQGKIFWAKMCAEIINFVTCVKKKIPREREMNNETVTNDFILRLRRASNIVTCDKEQKIYMTKVQLKFQQWDVKNISYKLRQARHTHTTNTQREIQKSLISCIFSGRHSKQTQVNCVCLK